MLAASTSPDPLRQVQNPNSILIKGVGMGWLLNSNYKKGMDGAALRVGWIQEHRVLPSLSFSSPPCISVWACTLASLSLYNWPHTLAIWPQATQAYIPLTTQTRLQKKDCFSPSVPVRRGKDPFSKIRSAATRRRQEKSLGQLNVFYVTSLLFSSLSCAQLFCNSMDWQVVVHWRRQWQTTSLFLPWEPHEQDEKAKRYDTER